MIREHQADYGADDYLSHLIIITTRLTTNLLQTHNDNEFNASMKTHTYRNTINLP